MISLAIGTQVAYVIIDVNLFIFAPWRSIHSPIIDVYYRIRHMDAMSDLLRTIQLSSSTYICRGGSGHWRMQIQYRPQGIFHIVVSGSCYLQEGGRAETIILQPGDVVAFPTGGVHSLSDALA